MANNFTEDIHKFIEKTENKLTKLLQNVAEEFSIRVVERTGVDTGNLLGNYLIGINNWGSYPNYIAGKSAWDGGTKDENLAAYNKEQALKFVIPRIKNISKLLKYTDTWFFGSSEDYAAHVEYLGWKKTPAYRMFGTTKAEFNDIVEQETNKLKNV